MGMVFVTAEQYQEWANGRFDQLKGEILRCCPQAQVEHIGASAVPGLVSKGDLDMLVALADEAALAAAIEPLCQLGFAIKADTLRLPNLCMLEFQGGEDIALQLVAGDPVGFLRFRDALRASPALCQQYSALKWRCQGMAADEYRSHKRRFVEAVLAGEVSTELGESV